MSKICHKLVSETAKAIAAEVYEVCASNNQFYKTYPNVDSFVSRCWSKFIGDARKSLTVMLRPKSDGTFYYSEHIRNEIYEALQQEGEMKSAPELDLNQLRASAGLEPLKRPLLLN